MTAKNKASAAPAPVRRRDGSGAAKMSNPKPTRGEDDKYHRVYQSSLTDPRMLTALAHRLLFVMPLAVEINPTGILVIHERRLARDMRIDSCTVDQVRACLVELDTAGCIELDDDNDEALIVDYIKDRYMPTSRTTNVMLRGALGRVRSERLAQRVTALYPAIFDTPSDTPSDRGGDVQESGIRNQGTGINDQESGISEQESSSSRVDDPVRNAVIDGIVDRRIEKLTKAPSKPEAYRATTRRKVEAEFGPRIDDHLRWNETATVDDVRIAIGDLDRPKRSGTGRAVDDESIALGDSLASLRLVGGVA